LEQRPEKDRGYKFIILILIFFFLAIIGTIYNLKGSGVKIGKSDSPKSVATKQSGNADKKTEQSAKLPDLQKGASRITDTLFGSDQEVGV